jgi:hypothetical protein
MGAFFGFPGTSNNAPQPVPITGSVGTNTPSPAKANPGVSGGVAGPQLNTLPVLGQPAGVTTPSSNTSPFGTSNIAGLNSGLTAGANMPQLSYQLDKAYGSGTGSLLSSILSGGLFNPGIAQAMLAAMQPGINQGEASLQQAFGAEGSRFGSADALGLGNYLSQVNLNEQSTLANMFQTSQGEELNLLQNLLPTIHQEKADSGGILSDILGGLETVGGIASAFIPGAQGLAPGLISGGIGNIVKGNQGPGNSGGGGGGVPSLVPSMSPIYNANTNSNSAAAQLDATSSGGYGTNNVANTDAIQTISAGATLGGADPFGSPANPSDPSDYSNLFPALFGQTNIN